MMERNPALAMFLLFIGCFVVSVGLFIAWNGFEKFAFMSLTLVSLNVVFVPVTVSLAVAGLLAEVQ